MSVNMMQKKQCFALVMNMMIIYLQIGRSMGIGTYNYNVSGMFVFGDSIVDVGNNDYIPTLFKADFPPYGRDYPNNSATGRFCNGKLVIDMMAESLGFQPSHYPLPYLSPRTAGRNLLRGVNFASAASGYDDSTAILFHGVPMSQQLQYFRDYQVRLVRMRGRRGMRDFIHNAVYIIGAGSSDFLLNYYMNPLVSRIFTPRRYSVYLDGIFSRFVIQLYRSGARMIAVTSLPPLGCLPLSITLFGLGSSDCVAHINEDARYFNRRLNSTVIRLQRLLPGLRLAVFDIYNPLYDLIHHPSDHGIGEARRGCCATGTFEATSLLCNPRSIGTCRNASAYVFWDSIHPTEATNHYLHSKLIIPGLQLLAPPIGPRINLASARPPPTLSTGPAGINLIRPPPTPFAGPNP